MDISQRDLSKMLESAIVAARLGGQRAIEELNYIKTSVKNNEELVTAADSICQKIIIDRIKETHPDHGFIAEEGAEGKLFKQPPRGDQDFWWVIDPIDGTNNYAHGILLFTISIALMHKGEPIVGVIFEPATDSMYTAVKGGDAQLNDRKITCGQEDLNEFSSVSLDSHFGDSVPQWAQNIMIKTKYRCLGTTALHLAYVAKGSLVASIIPPAAKIWDIAAGVLIAKSAGAIITNMKGENIFPVDLDSYQRQGFSTLAANPKVHPEILEMIKT